jgi:hypothetical protein
MTSSVVSKDDLNKRPSERFIDAVKRDAEEAILAEILNDYLTKETKLTDRNIAIRQLLNPRTQPLQIKDYGPLLQCFSPIGAPYKVRALKFILGIGITVSIDAKDGHDKKQYLLDINQTTTSGTTAWFLALVIISFFLILTLVFFVSTLFTVSVHYMFL